MKANWHEVIGTGYSLVEPTEEEAASAEAYFLHDQPLGDTADHYLAFARHTDGHLAGICKQCGALMVRASGDSKWQLLQTGYRRKTTRGYSSR